VRVKRKTSKKRLRRTLVVINQWLRQERNERTLPDLWQAMARQMRGHCNDFGVTDNGPALWPCDHAVSRLVCKWVKRRRQRRSFSWERFRRYATGIRSYAQAPMVSLNPYGDRLHEEFVWKTCSRLREGRPHNGAGSNTVILPTPKAEQQGIKADLTTGGVPLLDHKPRIRKAVDAPLTRSRSAA
jgi:hypothetical protein